MNYKKIGIISLILVIISFFIIGWIKRPDIKNAQSKGANIIAFGDSLVYGIGASKKGETDIFSLVSKEMGVSILNKGVPGDKTSDGLERLDRDVISQDPKIVFVLLGGNDYLQKVPKEETFNNLKEIVEKIQDAGAAVILIGVRGGLLDHFEKDFESLSKEYKTGYVPDILDGIILNRELMFDSIHPNDKGYKIISLKVSSALRSILDLSI